MKKILLICAMLGFVIISKSQVVLNEIYSEPGGGKSEFIELYNSSTGTQDLDCFTILTYWESGANRGWYVLDLPATTLASTGYFVLAASNPFNVQSQSGVSANLNWNSATFRTGSDGYLLKYQVSGSSYIAAPGFTTSTVVSDLSVDVSPTGASGHNYFTFVFQNGSIVNGFWGGGPNGTLPSGITSLPDLTIMPAGACGAAFTIDFSTLGAVENVNQAPGSDNGYARTSDGKCGTWEKTSASVNHTPGLSNGSASSTTGSLTTSQVLTCNTGPGVSTVTYNITGVSGSATEADDFPVEVQLFYDFGTAGVKDGADIYQSSYFDALISDPAKTFTISQTQPVLLVFKTKRGCFDKVVPLANGCLPLPVSFKSFTAVRSQSTVNLKWETFWEQNSSGFAVERNTNGTWQQVGFVASQAQGGNSADILTYQFSDPNNVKGISQYRIKQVDFDNKSKYSEVRSVRGEAQMGSIIIYPNPSMDGKVYVSFEETTPPREVSLADMSGRIIRQWKSVTNNSITIENLTPGLYTLRAFIPATGEQQVQKIVVNKR
jgi:hypothetical protein